MSIGVDARPRLKPLAHRYGRWVVKERQFNKAVCECDCGVTRLVDIASLRRGASRSCGCLVRELSAKFMADRATHHGYGTPTYRVWQAMLGRCRNPKHKSFAHYGGRGISVDPRWLKFENFVADMGVRDGRLTLDRIDVNGDYTKSNCRWATFQAQARNKRTNVYAEFRGKKMLVVEWCEMFGGMHLRTLRLVKAGWPIDLALFAPRFYRMEAWKSVALVSDEFAAFVGMDAE